MFFYLGDEVIPSLRLVLNERVKLKRIAVDMGAVKFVVKGADIMREIVELMKDKNKRIKIIFKSEE